MDWVAEPWIIKLCQELCLPLTTDGSWGRWQDKARQERSWELLTLFYFNLKTFWPYGAESLELMWTHQECKAMCDVSLRLCHIMAKPFVSYAKYLWDDQILALHSSPVL